MKIIITSEKDIAGCNMYELFIKEFGFKQEGTFEGFDTYKKDDILLIKTHKEIADLEHLSKDFKPSLYICASRHRSEKEVKSLTVHVSGNWGEVGYHGQEKKICFADALAMRKALIKLTENPIEGFEITLEVTHHGPSEMNAPILFVEVGSSEEQWRNIDACRAVCKAILAAGTETKKDVEIYAGFGGPHYAPNFTKAVLNGNIAIGHIIPKHYMDSVDERQIMEAVTKTVGCSKALLDWKGLSGEQRDRLISVLEKNKIEYKKTKEFTKE
jgi:D-aminoacyl-tRNA deacylase